MYLVPLLRANRAIAACIMNPLHPIESIAASEIISVVGPLLNPKLIPQILGTTLAIMYQPYFANYYLKLYMDAQKIYYQTEICFLLLFISIFFILIYIN